jgi:peptide/nickel transport system substrate-binding protein
MTTRRDALSLGLTLTVSLGMLVAFGPGGLLALGPGGPGPAHAAPQGKVIVAQGVDPTTLDPHLHLETPASNVLLQIYDTLLFRDRDLKLIPWLAESWKLVNPTTWEFKIRKGAKFHNGEDVDAEAVKYSLERIVDPNTKPQRQITFFGLIERVDVVDKYTARVITKRPFPVLENNLALLGNIVPPKYFKGNDMAHLAKNPVGSGPYKFVRWSKDEQIVMEANETWWGGVPKVKTLVFRPIPEHAVRVAALQAGEIDIAVNIPPHLVPVIDKHPRLYASKAPSVRTIFIPIYTHKFDSANKMLGPVEHPTKDKRVRQALNYAVDVDEVIKTVLEGQAIRVATPLTPRHFGFDATLAPFKLDVARAKKLLADAGYPNGIDLVLNSPDGRYLKDKEVSEAIAGQLTKASIRTTVRVFEWTTYLNKHVYIHAADPMFLIGWGNTNWDADGTLFPLWRSGQPLANFSNPDFDGLVEDAKANMDPRARLDRYARALRVFMDEAPAIPLYQQMDLYGVNKRVNFQALSSEQIVGVWLSLRDPK